MDSSMLKNFQNIVKFIEDLTTGFGSKQHSLVLYNRLVSKTKIIHVDSVKRHINTFHEFITINEQAIIEKNISKIKNPIIFYSKKVNIKMDEIFKMADNETSEIVWRHLLVIMNGLNPKPEVTNILKKSLEEKSNEGDFLSNLVSKLENTVDPNTTDPMSAIMGLMSNGVFTDIISSMNTGMSDGSLNLEKLFSTVQGMMTTLGGDIGKSNPTTISTTTAVTTISSSPPLPTILESNSESVD
jgi:hypothetical protein